MTEPTWSAQAPSPATFELFGYSAGMASAGNGVAVFGTSGWWEAGQEDALLFQAVRWDGVKGTEPVFGPPLWWPRSEAGEVVEVKDIIPLGPNRVAAYFAWFPEADEAGKASVVIEVDPANLGLSIVHTVAPGGPNNWLERGIGVGYTDDRYLVAGESREFVDGVHQGWRSRIDLCSPDSPTPIDSVLSGLGGGMEGWVMAMAATDDHLVVLTEANGSFSGLPLMVYGLGPDSIGPLQASLTLPYPDAAPVGSFGWNNPYDSFMVPLSDGTVAILAQAEQEDANIQPVEIWYFDPTDLSHVGPEVIRAHAQSAWNVHDTDKRFLDVSPTGQLLASYRTIGELGNEVGWVAFGAKGRDFVEHELPHDLFFSDDPFRLAWTWDYGAAWLERGVFVTWANADSDPEGYSYVRFGRIGGAISGEFVDEGRRFARVR